MEKNYVPLKLSGKFFRTSLRSLGYTYLSSLGELIDGPVDKGATKVEIIKTLEKDGSFTLTIIDNGGGMPSEDILEMMGTLGYEGDYDSTDISNFGGGAKLAMLNLCPSGEIRIESVHNKKKSILYFNAEEVQISDVVTTDTEEKNGTIIIIPNCSSKFKTDNPVLKFLGYTYSPHARKNPDFQITYNGKIVEFVDPFYRDLPKEAKSYVQVNEEKCEMFGGMVNITGYSIDRNMPFQYRSKIDTYDRGLSRTQAGIWLEVGGRFIVNGDGLFLKEPYNTRLNDLRILVKPDKDIIKDFGIGINKSLWNPDLALSEFARFTEIIRGIMNSHVKMRKSTEPQANELNKEQKEEQERVEKEVNARIKNTLGNILKKPGIEIPKQKVEKEETEKTKEPESTRERISGYKQDRSIVKIDARPMGERGYFIDYHQRNGKFWLVFNSEHPYYSHYMGKKEEEKVSTILFIQCFLNSLLYLDRDLPGLMETERIPDIKNDLLEEFSEQLFRVLKDIPSNFDAE